MLRIGAAPASIEERAGAVSARERGQARAAVGALKIDVKFASPKPPPSTDESSMTCPLFWYTMAFVAEPVGTSLRW